MGVPVAVVMVALLNLSSRHLLAEQALHQARGQTGFQQLNILTEARELNPFSYAVLSTQGTAELRLRRPLSGRRALEQAIASRPSWPYAWLRLAEWHARQGDWSGDFDRAVSQAYSLGKNSSSVAWRLAYLTLHAPQERLRSDTARILDENLERSLIWFNKKLLGRALLDNKVDVVCKPRWLEDNAGLQAWCKGAEWLNTACKLDNLAKHHQDRCEHHYNKWRYQASRPIR